MGLNPSPLKSRSGEARADGSELLKVGFVLPANSSSGGIYVALHHALTLNSIGHDVTVIFVSGSLGLDITSIRDYPVKTASLDDVVASRTAYDVVIATWWETFYSMFSIDSVHYLYLCQSDERRFYASRLAHEHAFVERTYTAANVGYIVVARWMSDWLSSEFGVAVQCAPNGIDLDLFNPDVRPLAPRGEKLRVLIEGAGGVFFKRIPLAFRVVNRFTEIEVWYVSNDGYSEPGWRYDRMFSNLRLDEMPPVYASCDILVKLSSIESFSYPPLEMMACGGTAIVSRFTGCEEYIRDGGNALVVDVDDEDAATAALARLIEDSELRRRLSEEGVRTAQAHSWQIKSRLFPLAVEQFTQRSNRVTVQERNEYMLLGHMREAYSETTLLRAETVRLRADLESMSRSRSYRIGRAATAFPRMLRDFFSRKGTDAV